MGHTDKEQQLTQIIGNHDTQSGMGNPLYEQVNAQNEI